MAPKIVSLFLIQFDVKVGYKILWDKTNPDISIEGIEFKCLPSGIHEFSEDLVLFTHKHNGHIYYGLSKFRQNMAVSRDDLKMFSLGCLCESIGGDNWKPNEFVSNGFEYISFIDEMLVEYINNEDSSKLDLIELPKIRPGRFKTPLVHLPNFFNKFGPLVFQIFKLSLLRKRIIVFNKSKKDNYMFQCFNYLISVMSLIPSDLKVEVPTGTANFIQPLYNISLNDLGSSLLDTSSFIATTNDDILMFHPTYDVAIIIDDEVSPEIMTFNDISNKSKHCQLKSTFNDYGKFKTIYEQMTNQDVPNNKSTDNLSINTTSSFMNRFFKESKINYEPNWWLRDSTYPVSWTHYIWSAFSWFASAGQISNEEIDTRPTNLEVPTATGHSRASSLNNLRTTLGESDLTNDHLVQYVIIIGYFHKLIKKWFYLITEIMNDELYQGSVSLSYQDLIDMELDPYCKDDVEFIKRLIEVYWGVEAEVTSGLGFFC